MSPHRYRAGSLHCRPCGHEDHQAHPDGASSHPTLPLVRNIVVTDILSMTCEEQDNQESIGRGDAGVKKEEVSKTRNQVRLRLGSFSLCSS